MIYDSHYYDMKWGNIIDNLPKGGDYNYPNRQYTYDMIKKRIKKGSKVFDFACGVGIIGLQLEKEKQCKMSGCDTSATAIGFMKAKSKGEYRITSQFFGDEYDYIIACYFMEHITTPTKWLKTALSHAPVVLFTIPPTMTRHGEHQDQQWGSWDEFNDLFSEYKPERIDDYKGINIPGGFKAPVFEVTRG